MQSEVNNFRALDEKQQKTRRGIVKKSGGEEYIFL